MIADSTSVDTLLPSKASSTKVQTLEHFQLDNMRPDFCVHGENHFFSNMMITCPVISDHSDLAHAIHSWATG